MGTEMQRNVTVTLTWEEQYMVNTTRRQEHPLSDQHHASFNKFLRITIINKHDGDRNGEECNCDTDVGRTINGQHDKTTGDIIPNCSQAQQQHKSTHNIRNWEV